MSDTLNVQKAKETAVNAALKAGEYIRERVGHIKRIDYKGAFNLVTDVDRAAEALIVEMIKAAFPDDDILAEEGSRGKSESNRRWLIDPLDGTTNFTHSYPFFCVSIALEIDGEVELGAVYNPISQELFRAQKGKGAYLNDQPICVSGQKNISESLFATGFSTSKMALQQVNVDAYASIMSKSHGVRRDGSAALDLCFVACGRLEGYWELSLSPWDYAAGSLIVREAGGVVSNILGLAVDPAIGEILATNAELHGQMMPLLSKLCAKIRL